MGQGFGTVIKGHLGDVLLLCTTANVYRKNRV